MATPRRTKITVALSAAMVLFAAALTLGLWVQKEYRQYLLLYEAVDSGDVERVRALLNQGVNVNGRGYFKETAIIHAAQGYHPEVVRLLLDAGADVNSQDETGYSALLYALVFFRIDQPKRWPKDTETAQLLLQAGARIDLTSADGQSPRQWAEQRSNGLKRNRDFYAWYRQRGQTDPTQAVRSLVGLVLAKGEGAP